MASRGDFLILVVFTKGFLCISRPVLDSESQNFLEIDRENIQNREIQYLDFSDWHAPWAAARVHQYGLPDRFWCKSDQIKCCYAYRCQILGEWAKSMDLPTKSGTLFCTRIIFCVKLQESCSNCFKTILPTQEIHFKKNPTKKFLFFVEFFFVEKKSWDFFWITLCFSKDFNAKPYRFHCDFEVEKLEK